MLKKSNELKKSIVWVVILCLVAQFIFQSFLPVTVKAGSIFDLSPVYEVDGITLDGTKEGVIDLSTQVDKLVQLRQGTIHARFRINDLNPSKDTGLMTLFSLSNSKVENTYVSFYVNPISKKVGYELKNNGVSINSVTGSADLNNHDWHTVSYVFQEDPSLQMIYFDGELVQTSTKGSFLSSLTDGIDTGRIGNLSRAGKGDHTWAMNGDIDFLNVFSNIYQEEEIKELHKATVNLITEPTPPEGVYKSDTINLFEQGYEGSNSYRIPSLLTASGSVVIAAIDKRNTNASDWNNIDTVIRRSFDSGNTWEDSQVLIDLPEVKGTNGDAAFTIDPSMVQDKTTGRIFMLIDMFSESYGLARTDLLETGSGWKEVNNRKYFILRDYKTVANTGTPSKTYTTEYLLDVNTGTIYDSLGTTKTDYTVPKFSGEGGGDIFKGSQPAGNIFLFSGEDAGELKAVRTSYLWMVYSDDLGATWSNPIDLSSQVKKEWMLFIGTGPGVGIQIENGEHKGRLVFPVYHTNINTGGSQASAVIYSDDHGATWKLGDSPVRLDGFDPENMNDSSKILTENQVVEVGTKGTLKMFCRNRSGKVKIATSEDGGMTWNAIYKEEGLIDPYCQSSIIKYLELIEGKQAFIFSNPADSTRNNGAIKIGLYEELTDTFQWKYERLLHPGGYQYSSLAVLPNGNIGILYEGDAPNIKYTSFNKEWVMAGNPIPVPMAAPVITKVTMSKIGEDLTFVVDFDQYIIKMGTPVLKFMLNSSEKMGEYVSGNGTKQFTFQYKLNNAERGDIIVTNVGAAKGSSIGNRNNDMPHDVSFKFTTEISNGSGGSSNGSSSGSSSDNADKKEPVDPWDKAISEIENGTDKVISVAVDGAVKIPNQLFWDLSKKDGILKINGMDYTWTIEGKNIQYISMSSVDLTVTNSREAIIKEILTDAKVSSSNMIKEIAIKETENWGFKGELSVKIGSEYEDKKLYVTWYNPKTKQLESVKTVTPSKDQLVTIPCSKGGTYVITAINPILKPTMVKNNKIVVGKPVKLNSKNVLKNARVTYVSSKPSVAAVTKKGTIKGLKKGSTVITSKVVQNGKTYTFKTIYKVSAK